MRLRFPIPVAVLAGVVGLGAVSIAGAQAPTLQPAANPQVSYTVALNGANEVTPNVGDVDGTGQATVTVNGTTGQVCVNITTALTEPMTLMHIHTGTNVQNGAVLVDFAPPSGTVTALAKCVTDTPAKAQAIIANPAGHYLNLHSATFPNGAIRGQLAARVLGTAEIRLLDEPARAYDSRPATSSDGKLVAGTARVVDLSAQVPATAHAAVVTLTVTQTVGVGFVTAYSNALTAAPATSTINWRATDTDVSTTTTVAVDGSGKIALLAGDNNTHVIVDVIGYYL